MTTRRRTTGGGGDDGDRTKTGGGSAGDRTKTPGGGSAGDRTKRPGGGSAGGRTTTGGGSGGGRTTAVGGGSAGRSRTTTLDERFAAALDLQQGGDLAGARKAYQSLLRTQPSHVGAHMNMGVIAYAEGKLREAVRHFDAVLEERPEDPDAYYNRGKALMAARDLAGALVSLGRSLELAPGDPMAFAAYCACCLEAERPGDVLDRLDDAPPALRLAPETVMIQGRALLQMGRFDEARAVLGDLCERDPGLVDAWALLSKVHFCARDFDRALTAMKRAVVARPDEGALRLELGIIHAVKGDRTAAEEEFREARRLDPSLPARGGRPRALDTDAARHWDDLALQMHLMDRMRYWAVRGEWRGAVNELLVFSRKFGNRPCVLQELAAAYQLDGEPKRARRLYQQLLEREPQDLEARLQLSRIDLQTGELDEAETLTASVLRQYPDLPEASTLRGLVLGALGRRDEAEGLLRRALDRSPGSREALLGLGRLLVESDPEEAVLVLERAVRMAGGACFDTLEAFTRACRAAGEQDRLRRVLEEAAVRAPESLTVTVELARILLEVGLGAQARELYLKAGTLEARDLDEAILQVEALIFARSAEPAARLIRSLRRKRPNSTDLALAEALVHILQGKAPRDSIAWQRLLREAADLPVRRFGFLAQVLVPAEQAVLAADCAEFRRLFATDPKVRGLVDELEALLTRSRRSDSISRTKGKK